MNRKGSAMQNQFVDLYRNGIKTATEVARMSLENAVRLQEKQLGIVRNILDENKRSSDSLGEAINRDRARVRGEDRIGRCDRVDLRPEGLLDGQILEDRLDDEPGGSRACGLIRRHDPPERCLALAGIKATLVDRSREVGRDPFAPRLSPGEIGLKQRDLAAGRREYLGDAVTHKPCARHEDRLDRHRTRA